MSLALCVYELATGTERALYGFAEIAVHLGLSSAPVTVEALPNHRPARLSFERLASLYSLISDMDDYSLNITFDDPNTALIYNSAPYVSYVRTPNRASITIFSPQREELQEFSERFLTTLPAKYGFGTDWNSSASFWAYAHGFQDWKSMGGDLLADTPAGRWGVLYNQSERNLFDQGHFRDIYPVNLLTTAHLNRETGDGTVRELILGHKDWGELARLSDNWFAWCVPLNAIENVRRDFESRGLFEKT